MDATSRVRDVALKQAIQQKTHLESVFANPLAGLSLDQVRDLGEDFAKDYELSEDGGSDTIIPLFRTAAVLSQNNEIWRIRQTDSNPNGPKLDLSDKDIVCLREEETNKLKQPLDLYLIIAACALSAAVQGWNETAPNGANIFYRRAFGLEGQSQELLYGLVNSAPYLCCAVLGCWLTYPLNNYFGRKWTIFITCFISVVTCIGQSFADTWGQMLAARFLLGLSIGPKSATAPVWAAESAPARIRGRLVMFWQMWTAFGIALGLMAGAILHKVGGALSDPDCLAPDASHDVLISQKCSLNWRLMMGSQIVLPIIACIHVLFCQESPRWHIKKGNYKAAYQSLIKLRNSKVQGARDLFYMHCLITVEREARKNQRRIVELFTVPRNRRAVTASVIVMFLQQLCGVNVIVYYSSEVIYNATHDHQRALLASMGFGILNFVFAFPAFKYIDSWGRRKLLLVTFPFMALFMLLTGLAFLSDDVNIRTGLVMTGMYLFTIMYSPGEGPVPFTYSAECHALHVRDLGMSLATSVTWTFNFILSFTWPAIDRGFKQTGSFGWYAAWNVIGFFMILFFVPETKHRTLEELDKVFEIPTRDHIFYGMRELLWGLKLRKEKPLLACDRIRMQEESGTIGSTLAFPADGTENFRNRKHGFGGMGGEGGGGGGDDLGEKLRPGPVVTRTESSDDRLTDFPPV